MTDDDMSDFDDEVRQALRAGRTVEIGGEQIDSVRSLLTELFHLRSKVILAGSVIKIAAFWLLAVIAAVFTFLANDDRSRFLWGFSSLLSTIAVGILWQSHWMFLNRNAVLRELKRLELQIVEAGRAARR